MLIVPLTPEANNILNFEAKHCLKKLRAAIGKVKNLETLRSIAFNHTDDTVRTRCLQKANDEKLAIELYINGLSSNQTVPFINSQEGLWEVINFAAPFFLNKELFSFKDYTNKGKYPPDTFVKFISKVQSKRKLIGLKENHPEGFIPFVTKALNKRIEELSNAIDYILEA